MSNPMHPTATRESVARLLEAHGVTPTEQRLRVGELMFATAQHLSAEQVLDGLRSSGARISKATVYNTLNLFAERGLLRQINIDSTRACFDSNTGLHYHFHNLDTGELTDVGVPEVEFRRLPELPAGTELAGVDVVIRVRRKA
ncbi:MAG TPA: Fur family transcriptional regulator [Steroidobacteraceae bacterium]|jgi:Fur family iron response transcriptional regulator|nr:Fur family transcriptional regulator [Steroidobacteraceae bacterium]